MFCFDLDDTLVSEAEYVESGLGAVGRHLDALAGARPGDSGRTPSWIRPADTAARGIMEILNVARTTDIRIWIR